jgi:AcrR family transcriptional regulator
MGRPAKFDVDAVLDAALRVLERGGIGALTAVAVCKTLEAPSGSFYHRFASRDALLVELWLRCAERFQAALCAVLDGPGTAREVAHAAVRGFVLRAREQRGEALMLMAYRREDLIAGPRPPAVRRRARALESMQNAALQRFAGRLWPQGQAEPGRMVFALLDLPLAAAMAELRGSKAAARDAEQWVAASLDALLGDCWGEGISADATGPADRRLSAGRR